MKSDHPSGKPSIFDVFSLASLRHTRLHPGVPQQLQKHMLDPSQKQMLNHHSAAEHQLTKTTLSESTPQYSTSDKQPKVMRISGSEIFCLLRLSALGIPPEMDGTSVKTLHAPVRPLAIGCSPLQDETCKTATTRWNLLCWSSCPRSKSATFK